MEAGTRVSFPAAQGSRTVTLFGTVVPSRFNAFSVVRLNDSGVEVEVHNSNLTAVVTGLLFCRECSEAKHGNCDGTAWSNELDGPAPCTCPGPSHAR